MDGINVTINPNVTDIPANAVNIDLTQQCQECEDPFLEQFSDQPIDNEDTQKVKGIIKYLKGKKFKKDVEHTAKKTGIPPRMIAKGIIHKFFGVINDVLGIAVGIVCQTMECLISILEKAMHMAVEIIHTIATGIINIITLNQSGVIVEQ